MIKLIGSALILLILSTSIARSEDLLKSDKNNIDQWASCSATLKHVAEYESKDQDEQVKQGMLILSAHYEYVALSVHMYSDLNQKQVKTAYDNKYAELMGLYTNIIPQLGKLYGIMRGYTRACAPTGATYITMENYIFSHPELVSGSPLEHIFLRRP